MTKRDNSLDVLRGMLLVMITINHIGGPLSTFTFQPMGFVSAAEGFVFLSGYILCLVYAKRLKRGESVTLAKICKRSFKIYLYHLGILFVLLIPYLSNFSFLEIWRFDGLSTFVETPFRAILAYSLLLFQPEHLDILPMYILFIPIGFLALKGFVNQKTVLILSFSLFFWILSQLQSINSQFFSPFHLASGFFNPFSWQILFIAGSYFGYSRAMGNEIFPKNRKILYPVLIVFVMLAIVRYNKENKEVFQIILDNTAKPNLQLFRLLNVFIYAYIIDYAIKFKYFPQIKLFAFLGRHSLQVFVFQVFVVYLFEPFRPEIFNLGYFGRIGFQILAAVSLFIPALIHYYYKNATVKKIISAESALRTNEQLQTSNDIIVGVNGK